MSNKIDLKSISELSGMKFFIPDYQRGYRWTKELVNDLLDDIDEFIKRKHGGFYCIQPLVVKKNIIKSEEYCEKLKELSHEDNNLIDNTEKLLNEYSQWEVIDGQQRLTTIYILLKYLSSDKENKYSIEYETREDSRSFLEKIDENKKGDNIDYHHISEANFKISRWFEGKDDYKKKFLEVLLENVKFIWYETINEDPIKVFTRLNIGKISLTNSELVKALFLNKSNFKTSDFQRIRLQQQEIAGEWDKIEYSLQSDEFWLFLNEKGYDKPTRIDFILDLICKKNKLELSEEYNTIGDDEFRTFRYFYTWFKKEENPNILECWGKIKLIFQTFNEWFNDLELYHYIGFLVEQGDKTTDILDKWVEKETKQQFIEEYIKVRLKDRIKKCSNLEQEYDSEGNPKKTQCRPLLLLHNIQTVINQGKELIKNEKYKLPVFYKFPFHLFKNESWDIEHIDSNTDNSLEDEKEQKEWLKAAYIGISNDKLKEKIRGFFNQEEGKPTFEELQEEITNSSHNLKLDDKNKNQIWNFCLLDASTNRGYGNSIFSAKRRAIIGKDQGKKIWVDDELNIIEDSGEIAFIPPCSRNAFMKYYNASTNNLRGWETKDAEAYKANIEDILKEFLIETKNNEE
jgi:uncharacterized protein with ParB-like and HNH nuclease domain